MYRKQMKTDKLFTTGDDPVIGNENDDEKRTERVMTLKILDWCENDRDYLARGIPYAHVVTMTSDCTEGTLKSDGLAKGAEVALSEIEYIPLDCVVEDTKERPQPPPNKVGEEAMIYIAKLENRKGRRGKKFRDFEDKVRAYLKRIRSSRGRWFHFSFVEYVVFEVSIQSWITAYPPSDELEKMHNSWELKRNRLECRLVHGVTPRHHASRYRDFITSQLEKEEWDSRVFTCFR